MDLLPIGRIFSAIKLLCVSECRELTDFSENLTRSQLVSSFESSFPCLETIFISHCPILKWYTINFLGMINSLQHVTITDIPIIADTSQFNTSFKPDELAKRRRYLLISNLPNIKSLNHSEITTEERTDAE